MLEEQADKMTDRTQQIQESGTITIRPVINSLNFILLYWIMRIQIKHRYAYQIEGHSDNWNYIDENYIRITEFAHGRYTLRIIGQNSSHGWSEQNYHWYPCRKAVLPAMVVHYRCCCVDSRRRYRLRRVANKGG